MILLQHALEHQFRIAGRADRLRRLVFEHNLGDIGDEEFGGIRRGELDVGLGGQVTDRLVGCLGRPSGRSVRPPRAASARLRRVAPHRGGRFGQHP